MNNLRICCWSLQVIVMSGHETIRVLEVEVDASQPSSVPEVKTESKAEEQVPLAAAQSEAKSTQESPMVPQSTREGGNSWSYWKARIADDFLPLHTC